MTSNAVTRIFECRAPLAGQDPDALIASLQAQMAKVMHLHPQLRGAALQASEGFLVMTLRVVSRDRSNVSQKARLIATRLLQRAKLDVASATLILVGIPADGRAVKAAS
jgi:hypothetical protein